MPQGLRIYSCSHSFHEFVYDMLAEMADAAGIKDHRKAGVSKIGGSRVVQFWDIPDENPVKAGLRAGAIDVLMLSPIWLPDPGIENFAMLAVEHKPDVRVTIQEYWLPNDEFEPIYPLQTGKIVDHNATTIARLREQHELYYQVMDNHVRGINAKIGKDTVLVAPTGQAVVALREKIIEGAAPGIKTQAELFTDSWGHATAPIKVLASYCHFAVVYKRSPVGLPMPTFLLEATNSDWKNDTLNRLLQELAWDAATHHPLSGVEST